MIAGGAVVSTTVAGALAYEPTPEQIGQTIADVGDDALSLARQADLLPGVAMGPGLTVDAPVIVDNLAVFPVYAAYPEVAPGKVGALHQAIDNGYAHVKEVAPGPYGAEVNKLAYANRANVPVLALGGMVFEGGFQDRMITRDLIIEPKSEDRLAVHCAEKSRWSPIREGDNTKGYFKVLHTMTGSALRATSEVLGEQRMVWRRVAQVNANHCKAPSTGTLAAVLDDPALRHERRSMAAEVDGFLEAQLHQDNLVGVAYSINGQVRHVRMFANSRLFQSFRGHLGRTAAYEALAEQGNMQGFERTDSETTPQGAVAGFVRHIRDRSETMNEHRHNKSAKTVYLHSGRGYGAIAMWKGTPLTASYISNSYVEAAKRTHADCRG